MRTETPTGRTRTEAAVSDAVVKTLLVLDASEGGLSNARVRAAATTLGLSPRSIRRKVKHAKALAAGDLTVQARDAWSPDDDFLSVYRAMGGNAKETLAALNALGRPVNRSLRTVQRSLSSRGDRALLLAIRENNVSEVKPTLDRAHIQGRNSSWAIDHSQLPLWVRHGKEAVKPWLTTIEDEATRMVMAFKLSPHDPTTATSIEVLARATVGFDVDGTVVGGKPDLVHSDRGGDLVNNAMMLGLAEVGIGRTTTESYSGNQNGRLERWHGIVKSTYLLHYQGYYSEARLTAEEKRSYGRLKEKNLCPLPADTLLTLEEATGFLVKDLHHYNEERPHSALSGMTPIEAWQADTTPIRVVDQVALRAAATKRESRTVCKARVVMGKVYYMSSDLDAQGRGILSTHEGRKVEIRYVPGNEQAMVWIFDPATGRHLCDAYPVTERTQDDVAATMTSKHNLITAYTASREDADRIRRELTQIKRDGLEAFADQHLDIGSRKSPSSRKKEARARTNRTVRKVELLKAAAGNATARPGPEDREEVGA